MTISLTVAADNDLTHDDLVARLKDAQVPFVERDYQAVIDCADTGTADFWTERLQQWGAKVEASGEPDGRFGTLDVASEPADVAPEPADAPEQAVVVEAQPGEAGTDVQPS